MTDDKQISSDLDDSLDEHRRDRDITGTVSLDVAEAYVGDELLLRGQDLPANETLSVVWNTTDGDWAVRDATAVEEQTYGPKTTQLTTVETDDDGTVAAQLTVPEDYGSEHGIELQTDTGQTVAETSVLVRPWFELERREVPLGETFEITGYGLGPSPVTSNYQVTWDNGNVGLLTGVVNNGTATAVVRAVGPVGDHVVQVWRNFHGVPYLQNNTQSPYGDVAAGRKSSWTVEVTEPQSALQRAWVDPITSAEPHEAHYPELDRQTAATLEVTPTSGQPGTTATIAGEGFAPNTAVDLVWHTHCGDELRQDPITMAADHDLLPTVTSDADGRFRTEVTIPRSMGSTRPITATVDGESVAVTGFVVQPKILDITPESGPVGTEIEIALTGIGWTGYDSAPYVLYDNRPVGYVDGIEAEDGVTRFTLHASGDPGPHFIDAYPSILETVEKDVHFANRAHLSYRDNHPMGPVPALHFTFDVTE